MTDKISVVTVTYGKRWHLLKQALESVINNELVSDIFIVDNGSKDNIEILSKTINSEKIRVIKTGENLGSAGGYYIGMKTAYHKGKGNFICKKIYTQKMYLLKNMLDNRPQTMRNI